jgi:hypothetical protein
MTRTLSFDYIWIDSLCIIQDNARDWEIESGQMASIYSNSYLTIAATKSSNGHGGLFSRTYDTKVSGTTPDGEDYCVYFRERIDHHLDMVEPGHESRNPTAKYYPLVTRAWCYQERMLSTRVLHFGHHELFFECKTGIECECGWIQYHGVGSATTAPLFKMEYADALSDYDEYDEYDVAYMARLWRTVVICYSAFHITKSSDRLPAIGSLAKQMASRRDSRYLAGLWEETINNDLIWWTSLESSDKLPRPYPKNAPTWSWASVETRALYWDAILFSAVAGRLGEMLMPPHEHYSTIEDCSVSGWAVDEFGAVGHGTLTISGSVVEGTLEREVEICKGAETVVHYVSFPQLEKRLRIGPDYDLDHDSPGKTDPATPVICLRMSLILGGTKSVLISLVLKKSPTDTDVHERIGTLIIRGDAGSVDQYGGLFNTAQSRTVVIV